MKKLGIMLLLCCLFLTGCGGESQSVSEDKKEEKAVVELSRIRDAMEQAVLDLPEMTLVDASDEMTAADLFSQLSTLDYEKVDDFFYMTATNQSEKKSAEELAVIRLKDSYDAADALASVKEHVKSRSLTFENYMPELVPMINRAEMFAYDKYVVLIIAKNQDEVKDVFYDIIGK